MNFENSDFLNYADIITLITSDFPSDKAELIANKLRRFCIICKQQLYSLQPNNTFKQDTEIKAKLLSKINSLIEKSFKRLEEKDQRLIQAEHRKNYTKIFEISNIEKYYPILFVKLSNDDVVFDSTFNELHFNNGYLDLTDKKFKQRTDKHYITKVIQRDYQCPTTKQKEAVLKELKKIITNDDDLKCVLNSLGSSLTGFAQRDQEFLYLLGRGSAGKSFIFQLTQEAIQCYFKEIQSDIFSQSNSKIDKILNTFIHEPQVRIIWINEMKGTKIDDSLFKAFIEGTIQTTKLFEDGSKTVKHCAKCYATANELLSIKVDSGTIRRINALTLLSEFVDDTSKVDEKKHVYLKDKNLLDKMKTHLLDAWVTILAENAFDWNNGIKPQWTKNFQQTKEIVVNSNDYFQDFIDSKLNITKDEKDRIGKEQMREYFLSMYPDKHMTTLQVITALRDRRIEYDGQKRCDGVKGCFVGVRLKGDGIPSDYNELPQEDELLKKIKEQEEEIYKLKMEIAKLKEPKEEKKIKVKSKPVKEIQYSVSLDDSEDEDQQNEPVIAEKTQEAPNEKVTQDDEEEDDFDNGNFIINFA